MKKIIISMFLIMAAGILVSCGKSKEEMDSYLVYYRVTNHSLLLKVLSKSLQKQTKYVKNLCVAS
mgnify:CR=1 FL=1